MNASTTSLRAMYDRLLRRYGPQHWWPANSAFEVVAGAILTQNTAWTNVEYALDNLKREGLLSAKKILAAHPRRLGALLRPAGYYNLKARRLRAVSRWWMDNGGHTGLGKWDTHVLRESLLQVNGVGPETADAVLLYVFDRPVFVVDAYARRILARWGMIGGEESYDEIRAGFEAKFRRPAAAYNQYHALIVRHAKEACRKTPRCEACCVRGRCAFHRAGATRG